MSAAKIVSSADVHPTAVIGDGAQIWHYVQIRERVTIGGGSILGRGVYVDSDVRIGKNCKLQNYVCTFHGVTLGDGVFVGPHACFTNDLYPRAINADGSLKGNDDWKVSETIVEDGAAIGANATVLCGIRIGRWAMIAAGSTVTRDVPPHGLVRGNPARLVGFVSAQGHPLRFETPPSGDTASAVGVCTRTGERVDIPAEDFRKWRRA
jgi:UDP-3-O-[3-hydroxymyristoyl] glucosamine N-acyltransferase